MLNQSHAFPKSAYPISALFALALACTLPGWSQEWSKGRILVKPGVGAGPVKIGDKLSPEAKAYLGPLTKSEAPTETSPGYSLFGKGDSRDLTRGLLLRESELKNPDKTTAIEIKGLRASTEEGVFLGGGANLITAKYPQAQKDSNAFTGGPEYVIPGLIMRVKNDKVSEFVVQSATAQPWRFQEVKVSGQMAGPIQVGKIIPPEAYKLYGEPTFQVPSSHVAFSGLVRWSLPGQSPARMIEVVLHDGVHSKVVTQIRLRGVAAITDRQIKLGDNASAVQSIYPEGRSGMAPIGGGETWRIPGLTFVLIGGKLTEMQIYKIDSASKH